MGVVRDGVNQEAASRYNSRVLRSKGTKAWERYDPLKLTRSLNTLFTTLETQPQGSRTQTVYGLSKKF